MAAAFRSAGTVLALGSRTNSVFSPPAGIVDGDKLYAVMGAGDGGDTTGPTVTPAAGFSYVPGYPVTISKPDPYATALHVFEKTASGESGNYTFTHGAADTQGFVFAASGAGSVVQSPSVNTNLLGGGTVAATTITPAQDGSLLLFACLMWDVIGPTTNDGGFTERVDSDIFYVATLNQATAAATGTVSLAAFVGSGVVWTATMLVIPPAGGGGNPLMVKLAHFF